VLCQRGFERDLINPTGATPAAAPAPALQVPIRETVGALGAWPAEVLVVTLGCLTFELLEQLVMGRRTIRLPSWLHLLLLQPLEVSKRVRGGDVTDVIGRCVYNGVSVWLAAALLSPMSSAEQEHGSEQAQECIHYRN
jgi:hypothetical protein